MSSSAASPDGLQGADLHTVDVDVVPERSEQNLQALCDALNSLSPRWRIGDVSDGLRIDGGRLEPRHILGSSIALGLVTSAGLVDIVLEPGGIPTRLRRSRMIGALQDLIRSKELLGREKDREHLPELVARKAELDLERGKSHGHDPGDDRGLGL